MAQIDLTDAAGGGTSRRLFCYAGGLLRPGRVRRILTLAGLTPSLGLPGRGDLVGVWGRSPIAGRGEAIAARRDAGLVRIEDAFLRSIRPGRMGDPPLGLMIDRSGGVHFDAGAPSALERLLATHPLDDTALLDRARDGIGRLIAGDLSKYNLHDPALPAPEPGYVLVIDQTRGDASIVHGGASASTFREMLVFAQEEHPGARILIRSHPETAAGLRPGHYGPRDAGGNVRLLTGPVSPWRLLQGAVAVYTVSSQLGFEAILAGHRPRVFGQPFYAGWGLTSDEAPVPRRRRMLTRAQLFAAAMILAPTWYDPCRDRLCSFEEAVDQLEAEARAHREDRAGHVAVGMRLWKRRPIQRVFGRYKPVRFVDRPQKAVAAARKEGRGILVWAGKETPELAAAAQDGLPPPVAEAPLTPLPPWTMDAQAPGAAAKGGKRAPSGPGAHAAGPGAVAGRPSRPSTFPHDQPGAGPSAGATSPYARALQDADGSQAPAPAAGFPHPTARPVPLPVRRVEDGFLRSRGLGADLVPPLSLVTDDLGIYYDPTRESRLERLIAEGPPPGGALRAGRLIARLKRDRLTKYNLGGRSLPPLPDGRRILVPGQVEDDASVLRGADAVSTNLGLLRRVRAANPEAIIIYKPHPDVEAGLRNGVVSDMDLARLVDAVAHKSDAAVLLESVDEVWTMTSALGFEALLRGLPVTCLGTPFYAGWGLTQDLGKVPARRRSRPDIASLAHAALIAYPRYRDPLTGLPCPAEVIAERLATGTIPRPGALNRLLAKMQGLLSSHAHLWR